MYNLVNTAINKCFKRVDLLDYQFYMGVFPIKLLLLFVSFYIILGDALLKDLYVSYGLCLLSIIKNM